MSDWETAKEIFSSWVVKIWDAFEIQALVLASLTFQILLAVYGMRRKSNPGIYVRFAVWFCYLMGTYVSTVALGKLTETTNDSIALTRITFGSPPKVVNVTNNELRALWAPLLLVHIGGPDGITAYQTEDNRLGYRQFLELGVQISVVLLIFVKSWNNSWLSIIALILLLSGAIKSLERVWALRCSASSRPVFDTISQARVREKEYLLSTFTSLDLLVKAYTRFEHLKPHIQNWIGHPLSINFPSMSTYYYTPEDVFKMAEFELGFMYDVLYTRSPINYSLPSFLRRSVCFLCLVSSLCGFALLFKDADVHLLMILLSHKYDKKVDIAITYLLLAGAVAVELYALVAMIYSDWALLYMINVRRSRFAQNFLQIFAPQVSPQWSNSIKQLNLLTYCLYKDTTWYGRILSRILKIRGWDPNFKLYRTTDHTEVPSELKRLIIEKIEEVSEQRVWEPFTKRGEWTLQRFKCLDQFKWSIQTDYTTEANQQTGFGRAVIIWHLATQVLSHAPEKYDSEQASYQEQRLFKRWTTYLSNYMLHLLADSPYMLSIVTENILFEDACTKISKFLEKLELTEADKRDMKKCFSRYLRDRRFEDAVFNIRNDDGQDNFQTGHAIVSDWDVIREAKVLADWDVIREAKVLAELLTVRTDRWNLLVSVWIEMLCYAAWNCQWVHHTEQLRQGGGLITHVWLLLNHETNKFNISIY